MSKYRLSKISGVPKTTIIDICSGKSSIRKCSAGTILLLSKALGCRMEELMALEDANPAYDSKTGLPKDKSYLEKDLPLFLVRSIQQMIECRNRLARGEKYLQWDMDYDELNADINSAEVDQLISGEQACYLRKKYLGMEGKLP